MQTYDAIVVGAGHNGLTTAAYLARAGRSVLVLERNDAIGGAVRSAEVTRPGYVHDVYSMNMNLFLASPVWAELKEELEAHGLAFKKSPKPYCNVFPDGTALRVYSDKARTREGLRAHNAADAEGWETLYTAFKDFKQALLPLYSTPLPSAEAVWKLGQAVQKVGLQRVEELAKLVLSSTRELGEAFFATDEARALIATWGLHLDFGPDVSGGGMFPLLEAFSDMEEGMNVVEGGASGLVDALAGIVRANGGTIRTGAEVTKIRTEGDRVVGVELVGGERIGAQEVVANLVPTVLYNRLLADAKLPEAFRRKVDRYAYGPATMMVHLALDGPAPWASGEETAEFAYVHIAPYVADLARTYTAAMNGEIPESPLLIVGQPTAVDPSRTPDGGHILWIQVRALPSLIRGDVVGQIEAKHWNEAKGPVAERVLDKLETYAPGVRDRITGRYVLSSQDLADNNPNLVGGDSVGGSHHLHQNFLWRPFAGWSRYATPLDRLYMVGAGAYPGGGNNATSGYLAAQEMLGSTVGTAARVAAGTAAGAAAVAALSQLLGSDGD